MKRYYLGIDTSCYTTSCAIIDSDFHIVREARKLLEVKPGKRGLQQSNMVFQHTKTLPKLMLELPDVYKRQVLLILVYLIILSILSATVVANPTMF